MAAARVHDLGCLIDVCAEHDPAFGPYRDDVDPVTQLAVLFRSSRAGSVEPAWLARAIALAERMIVFVGDRLEAGATYPRPCAFF